LKPEWWGAPLVQEKSQEKGNLSQEKIVVVVVVVKVVVVFRQP
jgi:hypothetical protein